MKRGFDQRMKRGDAMKIINVIMSAMVSAGVMCISTMFFVHTFVSIPHTAWVIGYAAGVISVIITMGVIRADI